MCSSATRRRATTSTASRERLLRRAFTGSSTASARRSLCAAIHTCSSIGRWGRCESSMPAAWARRLRRRRARIGSCSVRMSSCAGRRTTSKRRRRGCEARGFRSWTQAPVATRSPRRRNRRCSPSTRAPMADRTVRLVLKPLAFAAGLAPAASLAWAAIDHQFNVNPYNAIVRDTGFWSLRFVCLTVAVTPLRWLTGVHALVRFRRMLGLFAFFYAVVHLGAYLAFDCLTGLQPGAVAGTLSAILRDLPRPFFAIGYVSFMLRSEEHT